MKRRNLETCINSLIQFDTFKLIFYLHLITVVRIIYGQNIYAAYKIAPNEMLNNNKTWPRKIIPFTNSSTINLNRNVKVIY